VYVDRATGGRGEVKGGRIWEVDGDDVVDTGPLVIKMSWEGYRNWSLTVRCPMDLLSTAGVKELL
jgi:hypothetical protein